MIDSFVSLRSTVRQRFANLTEQYPTGMVRARSASKTLGTCLTIVMAVVYMSMIYLVVGRVSSPSLSLLNATTSTSYSTNLRGASSSSSSPSLSKFRNNPLPSLPNSAALTHLIVVAGHAVTITESLEGVEEEDHVWYLLPYQKAQDLPATFVAHIKAGVSLAQRDPASLLVFSGGQTRVDAGPWSEGAAYYRVAEHFGWWDPASDPSPEVKGRALAEEYALDSFENLLYSICRFKEYTGHYPTRITVVSFAFKRARFLSHHRGALRFPEAQFEYMGLDPPPEGRFDRKKAVEGEYHDALKLFESDPYGCHSKTLQEKRASRNPFRRTAPYALACPEIAPLLEYCQRTIYPHALPWDAH
ncbi:hypothetical protein VYU27_007652 [Nannochloropsis oceanica]